MIYRNNPINLTFIRMNFEERKKKILLNLTRKIGKESFNNLRCLYINELPFSVKIDTPILLFHYLDIGNTINLKLLLHNLKSVNLIKITQELESFIKETESEMNVVITIGQFFRALKDGLRISDMKKINYLLGRRDSTEFSLIMCDLIFYFGKHMLNWTSLWGAVAQVDEKLFKSFILPELEKISKKWPIRDESKYKERCLMIEISSQLSERNIEELAFFYKMPVHYMSGGVSGLEFVVTLEKENRLLLREFANYLIWIGWDTINEKIKKLGIGFDKPVEKDTCKQCVKNPLEILYKHSSIYLIREIARSQQATRSITNFDDLLIFLLSVVVRKPIDLTLIKGYLIQIERFDLIMIAERVSGQCNAKVLPEHRKLLPNDYMVLQLLEKLDPITTSNLAKAYGLKKLSLNFSGELLHYMMAHDLTDIDLLKKKLNQIERSDLIECLNVPIRE